MSSTEDQLQKKLRKNHDFTEEELEALRLADFPKQEDVQEFATEPEVSAILDHFTDQPDDQSQELVKLAKDYIATGQPHHAWKVILQS